MSDEVASGGVVEGGSTGVISDNSVSGGEGVSGLGPEASSGSAVGTSDMGDFTQLMGSLPEEIRADPSMADIKSLEGLAKSHINAQKMLGKERLSVPGEDASDEERAAFFEQLGRPANAEGYQFREALDGQAIGMDAGLMDSMAKAFHDAGLNDQQANAVVTGYLEQNAQRMQEMEEISERTVESTIEALKRDWGDDFEANLEQANEAAKQLFEGDQFEAFTKIRLADGSFLGDTVLMTKLMHALGDSLQEGQLHQGLQAMQMTESDAQQRLAELQSHPAYMDPNHPEHQQVLNERMRIRQHLGSGKRDLFAPQL